MFSRFFIERPIFASVMSIVVTLAGGVAVFTLPIAQYPPITPPTIQVMCTYPGASAQVVAETIASPIEQQVNGVENMLYMSSQCGNDGSYNLTVTFEPGVNLNFAQVLVQNRVNLALPQLPDVVKQTGITTRKRSPDILLLVSLNSPDNSRDNLYLSNYATIQIKDELARIEGVGDVFLFGGQDYSMRVWVDPGKLAYRNITAADVVQALRAQNTPVAAGAVGQRRRLPAARRQRPGHRRPGPGQDGGAEAELPRGRRLHHRLRHHAVHPRVRPGGVPHPARRGDPGRRRRPALPAELALHPH